MTKVETLAKEIWEMIQTKFEDISKADAIEVFDELSLNCERQSEHLQQEIDDEEDDPDEDEWEDDDDDEYDESDDEEELEEDD